MTLLKTFLVPIRFLKNNLLVRCSGFLSIDNQLYSFKYATLKCRYLNTIKNKNFIVDDAI